jgi:CheY-like chemotaxis protein
MPSVLIAEDELLLLEGLCQEVESLGWVAVRATTGDEAVRQAAAHPELDAVLLDQRMPGMTGLQASERLHETRPELAVALVTGDTVPRDELRRAGVVCVLSKPLHPGELREFLDAARRGGVS